MNDKISYKKINKWFFLGFFIWCGRICPELMREPVRLNTSASQVESQCEPIGLLIGVVGSLDGVLYSVADVMRNDFELSSQCAVTIRSVALPKNKQEVYAFGDSGYSFVLFLVPHEVNGVLANIDWRLYDTLDAHMIKGKKEKSGSRLLHECSHLIAHKVWAEMMNEDSPFLTSIVACKREAVVGKKQKYKDSLYELHPTYKNKRSFFIDKAMNVSMPRWHPYKQQLFFCQHTAGGTRLMRINEQQSVSVMIDREGLTMPPAFSSQGDVVLSISKHGKNRLCRYWFDETTHQGRCRALTPSTMHAINPCFMDDNRILFCAINNKRVPHVSCYYMDTGRIERLVTRGSSLSPAYNAKKNSIAYTQRVKGVAQLFIKDLLTGVDKQLTHDQGNKDYGSFSPCGLYLAYTHDLGSTSRIAVIHIPTNTRKFVTPADEYWSNPAWSPRNSIA
jgi:Tol biopolymer transport system component